MLLRKEIISYNAVKRCTPSPS